MVLGMQTLIAHPNLFFREGLISILEKEGYGVISHTSNPFEAIDSLARDKPDFFVTGLFSGNLDSYAALTKEASPNTKRVVLVPTSRTDQYKNLINLNFDGYFNEDKLNADDLLKGIKSVGRGENYYCEDFINFCLPKLGLFKSSNLSERLIGVLRLVSLGYSSEQSGKLLDLSSKTIGFHRHDIMRRLEIHTVAGLTSYALERGFVTFKEIEEAQKVVKKKIKC